MTLVELLVAMGITVLLLTVSIPIFSRQSRSGNVDSSARIAEEVINRARNLAFNPNREFPVRYNIDLRNGSDGKSINAVIQGIYNSVATPAGGSLAETIDQITIPNALITSGPANINFKPLTGEVINTAELPLIGMPLTIKAVTSTDAKTISINSIGNVEVR